MFIITLNDVLLIRVLTIDIQFEGNLYSGYISWSKQNRLRFDGTNLIKIEHKTVYLMIKAMKIMRRYILRCYF